MKYEALLQYFPAYDKFSLRQPVRLCNQSPNAGPGAKKGGSPVSPSGFALTQLTEPSTYASPNPPAAPFSASMAALLGQCCVLTYDQLQGTDITSLLPQGYSIVAELTAPEAITVEAGATGYYVTVPAGFVLTNGSNNIIALRGTQTIREWIDDAEVLPTPWVQGDNNGTNYSSLEFAPYGLVHAGFYSYYNLGTQGEVPQKTYHGIVDETYSYSRAQGSLAQQISALGSTKGFNSALPLYVTGHSLGAAAAVLCAMDVAVNLDIKVVSQASNVFVYGLACPNVAAGVVADNSVLRDVLNIASSAFVSNFGNAVTQCWLFANSCDIVPIMPPPSTDAGGLVDIEFQAVTSNIISFCAQTGTIGGNHSCADTYAPYLQALAGSFALAKARSAP
jgi:triacylglycerol lipase